VRRVAYNNAIGKYLELGRLDEARALLSQQIKNLGETPEAQFKLYEIAVRQSDRATAERYAPILEKSPMQSAYLQLRSFELLFLGRWRESQQMGNRLVELLKQQGLPQRGALIWSTQAASAANLGDAAAARKYAEAADALTGRERSVDFNVNLAVAYAGVRDMLRARRYLASVTPRDIPDEESRTRIIELLEALFALKSGRPADALARLQTFPGTDSGQPILVNWMYVRAHANAALKRWAEAEADFRDVIRRGAITQSNLAGPLAELGIARSLRAQGKTIEARDAYKAFLERWKQADPDLAEVKAAKAEAAALGS
jgi:hypothetical protein